MGVTRLVAATPDRILLCATAAVGFFERVVVATEASGNRIGRASCQKKNAAVCLFFNQPTSFAKGSYLCLGSVERA